MTETTDARTESYEFTCRRCGAAWKRTYEVRQAPGDNRELFLLNGAPVTAPRTSECPYCGGYRFDSRPRPLASPPGPQQAGGPPVQPDGVPLVVLRREQPVPRETRLLLQAGRTRLLLRHGQGPHPEEPNERAGSELAVHAAGTVARYSPAHWTEGLAQLAWERGDHWFQLIGAAGRDLLMRAAAEVMARADLTRPGGTAGRRA